MKWLCHSHVWFETLVMFSEFGGRCSLCYFVCYLSSKHLKIEVTWGRAIPVRICLRSGSRKNAADCLWGWRNLSWKDSWVSHLEQKKMRRCKCWFYFWILNPLSKCDKRLSLLILRRYITWSWQEVCRDQIFPMLQNLRLLRGLDSLDVSYVLRTHFLVSLEKLSIWILYKTGQRRRSDLWLSVFCRLRWEIFTEKIEGFGWGWEDGYVRTATTVSYEMTMLFIHMDDPVPHLRCRQIRASIQGAKVPMDQKQCKPCVFYSTCEKAGDGKGLFSAVWTSLYIMLLTTVWTPSIVSVDLKKILSLQLNRLQFTFKKMTWSPSAYTSIFTYQALPNGPCI